MKKGEGWQYIIKRAKEIEEKRDQSTFKRYFTIRREPSWLDLKEWLFNRIFMEKGLKERIYSKLGLLDVLMYERMQSYDNITRDGVEHDLIYLERILDKEIGEYTKNGGKYLRNEINGELKDYTDGNGY